MNVYIPFVNITDGIYLASNRLVHIVQQISNDNTMHDAHSNKAGITNYCIFQNN